MKSLPLTVALALITGTALADTPARLDTLVVTATRFERDRIDQPSQIRIISQNEIQISGARSIPELLTRAAGLSISSLHGATPSGISLDARGYGEAGNSHVLVLLDGRRLNAPDSHAIDHWTAIPVSRLERIEVQYGGGNVLFGDNAVGAVINLVTRAPRPEARLSLSGGSFGSLGLDGGLGLAGEHASARLDLSLGETDGYRNHAQARHASLGGRLSTEWGLTALNLDFGLGNQRAELPGYLTLEQARQNPRASLPGNGQGDADRRTWHLRPGLVMPLGDRYALSGELGYESNRQDSTLAYDMGDALALSHVVNEYDTWSLTPRFNLSQSFFGLPADSVLGIDLYRTDFASRRDYFGTTRLNLRQDSVALYGQTSVTLRPSTVLTAGLRRQRVDQDLGRTGSDALDNSQARNAWDLGLSHRLGDLRLFARHGQTFRFAKSDELTTFSGLGMPLRPEYGRGTDLGLEWQPGAGRVQATLYRQDMRDEIAYNANPDGDWNTWDGRNENLQRTRHQGFTLDLGWPLSNTVEAWAGYAYTDARFSAGPDDGKTLPLVPRQQARLGLTWQVNRAWSAEARADWSSDRYYGSDTDNSSPRLDGHATLDLAVTWHRGPWHLRLAGHNLTDQRYATTGFEYLASQYPADGRAFLLRLMHEGDL